MPRVCLIIMSSEGLSSQPQNDRLSTTPKTAPCCVVDNVFLLLPQAGQMLGSQARCPKKHTVNCVRLPASFQQLSQRLRQLLL